MKVKKINHINWIKIFILLEQLGQSAVGIKVEDGVVLAVERRCQSILMVPKSIEKIFEVNNSISLCSYIVLLKMPN